MRPAPAHHQMPPPRRTACAIALLAALCHLGGVGWTIGDVARSGPTDAWPLLVFALLINSAVVVRLYLRLGGAEPRIAPSVLVEALSMWLVWATVAAAVVATSLGPCFDGTAPCTRLLAAPAALLMHLALACYVGAMTYLDRIRSHDIARLSAKLYGPTDGVALTREQAAYADRIVDASVDEAQHSD